MYTIQYGVCFYYCLNIYHHIRDLVLMHIMSVRFLCIWTHDVLCLLFTYCMYFT